jgi:hypothetical protein
MQKAPAPNEPEPARPASRTSQAAGLAPAPNEPEKPPISPKPRTMDQGQRTKNQGPKNAPAPNEPKNYRKRLNIKILTQNGTYPIPSPGFSLQLAKTHLTGV